MKLLFAIFFAAASLFAQYTKNDFKLVKTTSEREFDKNIVESYLKSNNSQKVVAGLLSVSHSLDTSFVKGIVKVDFKKYGESVAFALGQIGYCQTSADFLMKKLHSKEGAGFTHEIYDALGKIADEGLTQLIFEEITQDPSLDRDGISIFIYNIFSRKVSFDRSVVKEFLLSELKNNKGMRRLEALFSIARLGGLKEIEKELTSILLSKDKINSAQVKSFAFACLARMKNFPNNKKLFSAALTHKDWRVRTEASKALPYFNFASKAQLNQYFKLIRDENPNVSRQAATSIRNITLSKILTTHLNTLIEPVFNNSKVNSVTKGELFISYCTMNPDKIASLIKKFDKPIQDKYIFEVLKNPAVSSDEAYGYLSKKVSKKEKDILDIIPTFLTMQKKLADNSKYKAQLFEWLGSKYSSVISTVAESLDSAFTVNNSAEIKKIIQSQVKTHLNDPRHYETLTSLYGLSEKAGNHFEKEISSMMASSKQFAVRKFISQKTSAPVNNKKDFQNLEQLWKNSFTFTKAKVTTSKGAFTIKLYPEYAPISVGNFVYLAKKGFYDDVVFHRVVPDFVAQTGDSTGTGFGGPGYDIVSEFSTLPFNTDYVGMASAGRDTEGSQWYVMHNVALHLYGRYSTFGKVINGSKVIAMINQGDKISRIELIK